MLEKPYELTDFSENESALIMLTSMTITDRLVLNGIKDLKFVSRVTD